MGVAQRSSLCATPFTSPAFLCGYFLPHIPRSCKKTMRSFIPYMYNISFCATLDPKPIEFTQPNPFTL